MFKIFKKKDIQSDVISDSGVVKKTDAFSVVVIIFSVIASVALIALGTIAFLIA